MIVEKDSLLTLVTIKPFVLCLEVDIGEIISGVSRFTNSGRAINPSPTDIFGLDWLSCGDLIGVNGLLDLEVILDLNISVGDSFLRSHLKQVLISSGDISLLVTLSGLNSKSPRSIQAGVLFVAICIGSIIKLYLFEMGYTAMFFEKPEFLGLFTMDVVLNVRGAFFSLL